MGSEGRRGLRCGFVTHRRRQILNLYPYFCLIQIERQIIVSTPFPMPFPPQNPQFPLFSLPPPHILLHHFKYSQWQTYCISVYLQFLRLIAQLCISSPSLLQLLMSSDRPDQWPSTPAYPSEEMTDDLSEYLKRTDKLARKSPILKACKANARDSLGETNSYEKFLSTLEDFHRRTKPPSYTVKTQQVLVSLSTQITEIKSQQIFVDKPKQKRLYRTHNNNFLDGKHQCKISHIQLEFSKDSQRKFETEPAQLSHIPIVEMAVRHKAARKSSQRFPSQLISNIYSLGHPVEDFEITRTKKAKYRANLYRHLHQSCNRKESKMKIDRILEETRKPKRRGSVSGDGENSTAQFGLLKGKSFLPIKARLAVTSHSMSRSCLV